MGEPHWTMKKPAIPVTAEMVRDGEMQLTQFAPLATQRERLGVVRNIVSFALKKVTPDDLRKALGETESEIGPVALFTADGNLNLKLFEENLEHIIKRRAAVAGGVHAGTCTDREGVEYAIYGEILKWLDPHIDW
jgi:hypothetical protein